MSLDITFHAIEWGVTTCPGYEESCHGWSSLIKRSLKTVVLRLKEILYCLIVARGSLRTLTYHSLLKYWMQKIKKFETKCVTTSPGLPYMCVIYNFLARKYISTSLKYTSNISRFYKENIKCILITTVIKLKGEF